MTPISLNWFEAHIAVRILAGVIFFFLYAWVFFQFSKGSGKTIFVLTSLGLLVGFIYYPGLHLRAFIVLLIFAIYLDFYRRPKKATYKPVEVLLEGGGIRRGLSAAEASLVLGRPLNVTLTLVMFGLVKKGMLRQGKSTPWIVEIDEEFRTRGYGLNPQRKAEKRKKAARQTSTWLEPYEEPFLEILEGKAGMHVCEIDFSIAVKPFVRQVANRVAGYDLEQTREYYRAMIRRAGVETRQGGELTSERDVVIKRNLEWILLREDFERILEADGGGYSPEWFPTQEGDKPFGRWATEVMEAMKGTIQAEGIEIKPGKELDETSTRLLNEIARATFFR